MSKRETMQYDDWERLPVRRLLILAAVLAVVPMVLVILLYKPAATKQVSTTKAPEPSEAATTQVADDEVIDPVEMGHAAIDPQPRPPRPESEGSLAASADGEGTAEPDPASRPVEEMSGTSDPGEALAEAGPDENIQEPAEEPEAELKPQWQVTLVDAAASEVSPWTALGQATAPIMPAPAGERYAVVTVEVSLQGPDSANLRVAGDEEGEADILLLTNGKVVPSLGHLAVPPTGLLPFHYEPVLVEQSDRPLEIPLVYLIGKGVESAELVVDEAQPLQVEFPVQDAEPVGKLAGTWRKAERQRLPLRFANAVMDALCSAEHSLLEVRRTNEGGWAFDWPLAEVRYTDPAVDEERGALLTTLTRQAHSCEAAFQLADRGDLLLLRLGSPEEVSIAYRRAR